MTQTDHSARTASSRETALLMVDRFRAGDIDGVAGLLHDDFTPHNPLVPHDPADGGGKDAFLSYLRGPIGGGFLAATVTTVKVLADGDLAAIHSHVAGEGGTQYAIVDLFRIEDERIIEHWDVHQEIPDHPANPHGMV